MGRDVLTIVQRLGWTHKVVHREVWIAPCPYCHDGDANPEKQVRGARGFSVNLDHGGGHCLACSWSGTILDLERDHGLVAPVLPFPDRGHERRSPDPPEPIVPPSMYQQGFSAYTAARDYLKSRGFEKDAVVAWKLGATIRRFGGEPFEAVAIPTLTEGGAPIGYKFRLVAPGEGPKYLKTKGTPQDLRGRARRRDAVAGGRPAGRFDSVWRRHLGPRLDGAGAAVPPGDPRLRRGRRGGRRCDEGGEGDRDQPVPPGEAAEPAQGLERRAGRGPPGPGAPGSHPRQRAGVAARMGRGPPLGGGRGDRVPAPGRGA